MNPGPAIPLRGLLGGLLALAVRAEDAAVSTLAVSLDPASLNRFWIDANDRVTLRVRAERQNLRLAFRDPQGMVWEVLATAEGPPGSYVANLERPAPGPWTLSVLENGSPTTAVLEVAYSNQVRPRLQVPRTPIVGGGALVVSLELLDHATRVKELRIVATVTRVDVETLPGYVAFHDDGTHGDPIARDGQFTATLPTGSPGRFRFEAQLEGMASTGRFQRTSAWIYTVVAKGAELTGRVKQRLLVGRPD